jgi:hypothetical protein
MPSGRVMKNALRGFLGTYSSRYSDYQGYWVFGQIRPHLEGLQIDLLSDSSNAPFAAVRFAQRLARSRFREQLVKSRLPIGRVTSASLRVHAFGAGAFEWRGDHSREGGDYRFDAAAQLDNGRIYEASQQVFVALHDPAVERRRRPDDWGRLASEDSLPGSVGLAVVV